ncbi:MAG: S8 family peptidase [bacterium]|nr:S8 family peptidase [bacterium]
MKLRFLHWIVLIPIIANGSELPPTIEKAFQSNPERQSIPIWVLLPLPENDYLKDLTFFQVLPEASKNRRILHNSKPDFRDRPITREWVDKILQTGAKFRTVSRYLQAVSVEATREQIREILQIQGIVGVRPVAQGRKTNTKIQKIDEPSTILELDSLPYGRARAQIQQINAIPLLEQGYSAKNVIGGILDTGYRLTHDTFDSLTILAQRDFIFNDNNVANEPQDTSEQWVHGTICLSVLGGYTPNELVGPAYKATMIVGKTENVRSETPVEEDYYVAGLEWCDSLGARGVSTSLGYIDWYTWQDMNGDNALCTQAVDIAASRGMLVATAAGNENGSEWNHIIAPADADSCLAVAAVDTLGVVATFSSRGPSYDGRIKPEVAACGVFTRCATPSTNHSFSRAHGTSLATPLVGGAMLLLWEKHPYWTAMMMHRALRLTASQASNPDTILGWGIINVAAADTFTFGGNRSPRIDSMVAIEGITAGYRLYYAIHDLENDSLIFDITAVYEVLPEQFLGRFLVPSGTSFIDIPAPSNSPLYLEAIVSDRVHILQRMVPIVQTTIKEQNQSSIPKNFRVSIYPNPFNSTLKVFIDIEHQDNVEFKIYNIQGKLVWQKHCTNLDKGTNEIALNFQNTPIGSGIYLFQVKTEKENQFIKLVYMK